MFTKKTIYLCGSMSHLKGFGMGWRRKIKKWLADRGEKCYDPCTEEVTDHYEYGIKDSQKQNWEMFPQPLQEEIMCKDLDQVGKHSKYLVCFFTRYSTGTVSELSHAFYCKVPVYIVTTRKLIGWVGTVAHADGNRVFRTFDDLKKFLASKFKLKRCKNVNRRSKAKNN